MQRDVTGTPEAKRASSIKKDAVFVALQNATPAQIDTWVDSNVASLADARRLFKLLLKVAAHLIRE